LLAFTISASAIGHADWAAGATEEGLTFAFPPNSPTVFTYGRTDYDADWSTSAIPVNYAAVTARGYHTGGVNALFMDGSVRFINNSIDQATWRGLGTRNGGEPVGDF